MWNPISRRLPFPPGTGWVTNEEELQKSKASACDRLSPVLHRFSKLAATLLPATKYVPELSLESMLLKYKISYAISGRGGSCTWIVIGLGKDPFIEQCAGFSSRIFRDGRAPTKIKWFHKD